MGFFSRFLNGQMLFERIETRILVGVVMFVGTLILVGWVAINETARMAAFEQQFNARAVERGAALYVSNCASCHNPDGYGQANRAPALNNPQLFGYDYFASIRSERQDLQNELNNTETPPTAERTEALQLRLGELDAQELQLRQQMQQATQRGYDPDRPDRLLNLGWAGSRQAFIFTTLVHGRPVSINYWGGNVMVAWSQQAGGPLRNDQLQDLTSFIMNWNRDFTVEDLLSVNQFAIEPVDPRFATGGGAAGVGRDGAAAYAAIGELTGDPNRGQSIYNGQEPTALGFYMACATCHAGGNVGPLTTGTWTRVLNERLPALPQYTSGEEYLVHSIVAPNEYVVTGYAGMPDNLGDQMDAQDLVDLVAFLMTQDQ
ncbi:MAG: c-type cytochrome [Chloroflexi bacterium]|nr:c-type cytochrome [Chloroflexota bacterium]